MAIKLPRRNHVNNDSASNSNSNSNNGSDNGDLKLQTLAQQSDGSSEAPMPTIGAIGAGGSLYVKPKFTDPLVNKWGDLSSNDKAALVILTLFLILVGGGFGGHKIHVAAMEQQETYQDAITDYFWLRGQAANIDPSQGNEQVVAIDQQLNQILAQSGAKDLQVLRVGDDAQISFTPANQAIASNILSTIANSGYYLKQLTMQQNPQDKMIRVQATVAKAMV